MGETVKLVDDADWVDDSGWESLETDEGLSCLVDCSLSAGLLHKLVWFGISCTLIWTCTERPSDD